jgi:hypothetical protein
MGSRLTREGEEGGRLRFWERRHLASYNTFAWRLVWTYPCSLRTVSLMMTTKRFSIGRLEERSRMTDELTLSKTMQEWAASLESAMPVARQSFLVYMRSLGFTDEVYDLEDGPHTVFRYVDDDGVSIFCGDWMATLTHMFMRKNWTHLEPAFKVATTDVPGPRTHVGEPPRYREGRQG